MKKMKIDSLAVMFFFSFLFIAIGLICGIFLGDNSKKEYPQTMTVVQIDIATDTVTCEDLTGNLWQFKGVEDWQEGDTVSMIMNNKGTEEIFDDEIIKIEYNGARADG